MGLHCRVCGLLLEVRAVPPTYCPRCLATRRRAVKLIAAPAAQLITGGERQRSARRVDGRASGDADGARAPRPVPSAAPLPQLDRSDPLTAALALAREETAMDVAVLGEIRDGREIVHALAGDATSFGLKVGASLAAKDTFCERLLEGRIPSIVRDAQADQRVKDLRLAREARIGAYIGVPISTRDARLYILCCLAHEQRPRLCERDVLFMRGVAATITATLRAAQAADDQLDDSSNSIPDTTAPEVDGRNERRK